MKDAATHSYLKKGQDIVDMNHKAIDLGATAYTKIDVPADWANAVDADEAVSYEGKAELVEQVKNCLLYTSNQWGDTVIPQLILSGGDATCTDWLPQGTSIEMCIRDSSNIINDRLSIGN